MDKDRYLLELSRYVVLNPLRVKGMVNRFEDWPWSSYLTMAGDAPKPKWLTTDCRKPVKKVFNSTEKRLSDKELSRLSKRYRNIITGGEKELPVIPPKPSGKRGKLAKSDAHNLWERLRDHENAVLLFARNPHVSFTNNRAERDLRMAKVKQKVSGCFRTSEYAHAYCRISAICSLWPLSPSFDFPCPKMS